MLTKKGFKLVRKIIIFALLISVSICSTSCTSIMNAFTELSDAEWVSAMNPGNFNNVTMETGGKSIKVLNGVFYEEKFVRLMWSNLSICLLVW